MTDLQRCIEEQARCAEYLLANGPCRGARLGLADNVAEELMIRLGSKWLSRDSFIAAEFRMLRADGGGE